MSLSFNAPPRPKSQMVPNTIFINADPKQWVLCPLGKEMLGVAEPGKALSERLVNEGASEGQGNFAGSIKGDRKRYLKGKSMR